MSDKYISESEQSWSSGMGPEVCSSFIDHEILCLTLSVHNLFTNLKNKGANRVRQ